MNVEVKFDENRSSCAVQQMAALAGGWGSVVLWVTYLLPTSESLQFEPRTRAYVGEMVVAYWCPAVYGAEPWPASM